ncbi:MAG: MgtC/SapB family protein [Deltaproteobacteria bacterium]
MLTLFLIKILLAGVVGMIIGTISNRSTARVFVMVCIGTALLTYVSTEFFKILSYPWFGDPGRLSAQAISAIGFIGTGMIWISEENEVEGLNVAASLWLTAILGMIIGVGLQNTSITALLVVLVFYWLFDVIMKWYRQRSEDNNKTGG